MIFEFTSFLDFAWLICSFRVPISDSNSPIRVSLAESSSTLTTYQKIRTKVSQLLALLTHTTKCMGMKVNTTYTNLELIFIGRDFCRQLGVLGGQRLFFVWKNCQFSNYKFQTHPQEFLSLSFVLHIGLRSIWISQLLLDYWVKFEAYFPTLTCNFGLDCLNFGIALFKVGVFLFQLFLQVCNFGNISLWGVISSRQFFFYTGKFGLGGVSGTCIGFGLSRSKKSPSWKKIHHQRKIVKNLHF